MGNCGCGHAAGDGPFAEGRNLDDHHQRICGYHHHLGIDPDGGLLRRPCGLAAQKA